MTIEVKFSKRTNSKGNTCTSATYRVAGQQEWKQVSTGTARAWLEFQIFGSKAATVIEVG